MQDFSHGSFVVPAVETQETACAFGARIESRWDAMQAEAMSEGILSPYACMYVCMNMYIYMCKCVCMYLFM